jgi:hypothetical protein
MNKQLENTLLKFKENNINNLDIFLGKYLNNTIFNKKLDENYYNTILDICINKNYTRTNFNLKIYNYGINYLDYLSKRHWTKTNIKHITNNNTKLFVTYLNTPDIYYHFPCKKNYHVTEQNIHNFKINDEISIMFINNNQIKINIKLNYNIDLAIKTLKDLFKIIN